MNMRKSELVIACACLCLAGSAFSQDDAAGNGEPKPLRDPFWPISYDPSPVKPDVVKIDSTKPIDEQQAQLDAYAWPVLKVDGIIILGGKLVANIKDFGVVEPGDTIKVAKDGYIYIWRIEDIKKEGVNFKRLEVRRQQK